MAVTGEIFYQLQHDEFTLTPNFQHFLSGDSADLQSTTLQLNSLRKARIETRKIIKSKIDNTEKLLQTLELQRQQILTSIQFEKERKQEILLNTSQSYDRRMMEIALEYSGLVHFELEQSRVNVRAENALVESLQRQAIAAYQMKIFSEYLSLETKGLMTISVLPKDSEQYKRCKKAIKDNITASFLRNGSYQGVRVLNVYHLSNQRLSRHLQSAVQAAPKGKVRGMFCAIPRQSIYSMCVYGLHPRDDSLRASFSSSMMGAQPLLPSPRHLKPSAQGPIPSSPAPRKKERKGAFHDAILGRNIFEWSWYCFPPQEKGVGRDSTSASNAAPLIKGIGTAMKLVSTPSASAFASSSSSSSLTTTPHSYLRFTRSSTPPSLLLPEMTSEDSSLSEEGCYLGLCRVLMNSVHTIPANGNGGNGELNSSDLMEAIRRGCDTVYAEKSEEYVLLQPQCCLPEFIIHMQLVKNFESSAAADSARLYSTLPQRSHRLAHSFPNDSSSLTEAQVERARRKQQWLSSVEQFFVPDSGAGGGALGNETELDDVGTDSGDKPSDSETVARRKRNLIRAVIDETRTAVSQLAGQGERMTNKPYL